MPERDRFLQGRLPDESERLGPDDRFDFRCGEDLDCFTDCCGDVSIILTPYDVIRMKKALGVDSSEFLSTYTISPFCKEQKIPVVLLRMDPETQRCPLVGEEGCQVYANRPWACRMYPLGVAQPKAATSAERPFHFHIREELCHGHGKGKTQTVRQWCAEQGSEHYEMMGAGFKELMLHDFWDKGQDLTPQQMDMYYMACYDLDRFRRFVFETRFLAMFDIDEARVEAIRADDCELLEFALQWLRFSLFRERTMKIKPAVVEARRRAASGSESMQERLANSNG